MAEAKKSTKKVPVAADKRKAADDALEARIAARKAVKPVEPTPTPAAEAAPFVPDTPKAEKPVKEKKERKPREAKPKAEVPAVSDLVAKIEAKAVAKAENAHAKVLKGVNAHYKAEIKKLKAGHKADVNEIHKAYDYKAKSAAVDQFNKGFEKGFAKGKAAANKAITAALKGR